jgi:hypothetical protein
MSMGDQPIQQDPQEQDPMPPFRQPAQPPPGIEAVMQFRPGYEKATT